MNVRITVPYPRRGTYSRRNQLPFLEALTSASGTGVG